MHFNFRTLLKCSIQTERSGGVLY